MSSRRWRSPALNGGRGFKELLRPLRNLPGLATELKLPIRNCLNLRLRWVKTEILLLCLNSPRNLIFNDENPASVILELIFSMLPFNLVDSFLPLLPALLQRYPKVFLNNRHIPDIHGDYGRNKQFPQEEPVFFKCMS